MSRRNVFLVAGCTLILLGCNDRTTTRQPRGGNSPPAVIDAGNGSEITRDFITNPIEAERKWIGKRVRIRQVVGQIDRDRRGFYVGMYHVFVYPAESELGAFAKVRKEEVIEVEATLVRYTTGSPPQVEGEDARLIANHGPEANR